MSLIQYLHLGIQVTGTKQSNRRQCLDSKFYFKSQLVGVGQTDKQLVGAGYSDNEYGCKRADLTATGGTLASVWLSFVVTFSQSSMLVREIAGSDPRQVFVLL